MSDPHDPERLQRLHDRIEGLKKTQDRPKEQEEHYSMAQHGWRMVIELVAGLGIGFGIGFGLDTLFGTMPLFLVLFILLGFVAGVKTMLRSANEIQEKHAAQAAQDDERV
ncbi:MAG: AtpZ/AtpI family protein [Pseudoruegeria sp.]